MNNHDMTLSMLFYRNNNSLNYFYFEKKIGAQPKIWVLAKKTMAIVRLEGSQLSPLLPDSTSAVPLHCYLDL